ncbi:MAG: hypothetical protein DRO40_02430 [Thermoprotei archaeon]|nr:MAG: hypothetical protein DRO40_02430 [Thermoprotei archaeon]
MVNLKKLRKEFWLCHSNPWSGLTRMLISPFLYLTIWYHNWVGLGIVILWTIVNPIVFPKPKRTDNWFSKAVLGEKAWLNKFRSKPQPDLPFLLNTLTAIFFVPSIYFAYVNMFWPTLYCATLMSIFKLWYVDRVALQYGKEYSFTVS